MSVANVLQLFRKPEEEHLVYSTLDSFRFIIEKTCLVTLSNDFIPPASY
jgi:hypothetical protein